MNLEEVMLNKCIEHFTSLNGESDSFRNSEKYGEIPSGLSIVFCDAVRRTEHFYKTIPKKRWLYENAVLTEQSIDAEVEEINQQNGIFFSTARAEFHWDLDRGKAFLSVVFGPRFGKGFSYDIIQNGDSITLENESVEWVS